MKGRKDKGREVEKEMERVREGRRVAKGDGGRENWKESRHIRN